MTGCVKRQLPGGEVDLSQPLQAGISADITLTCHGISADITLTCHGISADITLGCHGISADITLGCHSISADITLASHRSGRPTGQVLQLI